MPAMHNLKERSRIARYFRLLCGIMESGDTLSFGISAILSLMSDHGTSRAKPCSCFSWASIHICSMASGTKAEMCAPRSTAAQISSGVQSRPQSTGQPLVAYSNSAGPAGCKRVFPRGHMRPQKGGGSVSGVLSDLPSVSCVAQAGAGRRGDGFLTSTRYRIVVYPVKPLYRSLM